MKPIALLLFLYLSPAFCAEDCVREVTEENMWELKLHKKLMCNYNSAVPPRPMVKNRDSINVILRFIFKKLNFYSEDQLFSTYMWTYISWHDDRLKWNTTDFGDIEETPMSNYKLWIPGIKLINSVNDLYDQRYEYVPCKVRNNGEVQCFSWIIFETNCATDLKNWPFDTQVCSLEFGPWKSQGANVSLDFPLNAVTFIDSEYGAEWDVIDYKQEEDQSAVVQLKMNFTMVRHGDILGAIIIPPSVVLSMLTIFALFIDTRSDSRLFMLCFSLVCHFYFLSELSTDIPPHSKTSPKILLYFRGSVIMTIISLSLTFFLKILCKRDAPMSNFIAIGNEYVYNSYGKFLIFPRWESRVDDKSDFVKAWTDFSNVLNSIWILVLVMVYIIMFCSMVPTPTGLLSKIGHKSYDFQ